jgi:predicted membrane chloride channel (bestrophin family)
MTSSTDDGNGSTDAIPTTAGRSVGKTVFSAVQSVIPSGSFRPSDDKRWEALQRIERRRRNILLRTEEPFWRTLMYWDGTVLSALKFDSLLWITIAIYVGVRCAARNGLPEFVAGLDSGRMAIVGGFLTFFMVFYVNQTNARFLALYGHSMACKGRIFDAATLARTCRMPHERALRLIRYLNAAHAAAYVGLSPIYPACSYFNHVDKNFQLLTKEERARMDRIDLDAGGAAHRELVVWATMEVQKALDAGMLDNELAAMLRGECLKFRIAAAQLYDAADLPIPFFYVHFISLLTALYLPLFALTQGINAGSGDEAEWAVDVVVGLVVVLQSIFVIGLRILGQKLSDPFGDDLVDLSVMFFVQFTWTQSTRILASPDPPHSAYAVETELARRRVTVGSAWDADTDNGLGNPDQAISTIPPSHDDAEYNDHEKVSPVPTAGISSNFMMEDQKGFHKQASTHGISMRHLLFPFGPANEIRGRVKHSHPHVQASTTVSPSDDDAECNDHERVRPKSTAGTSSNFMMEDQKGFHKQASTHGISKRQLLFPFSPANEIRGRVKHSHPLEVGRDTNLET